MIQQLILKVETSPKQLNPITDQVSTACGRLLDIEAGLINLFIQHTSASLLIQENADPSARKDLQGFMERLAPENQDWVEHTAEGPDDSPSHMRAAVTDTSLTIPIQNGRLGLGTWQGIYVWEHRMQPHTRKILMTLFH